MCLGLAAWHLGSMEKLDEICSGEWGAWMGGDVWGSLQTQEFILVLFLLVSALQPLQTDSDPSVSSLAIQMSCILRSRKVQRKQGFILRALCCWCPEPGG